MYYIIILPFNQYLHNTEENIHTQNFVSTVYFSEWKVPLGEQSTFPGVYSYLYCTHIYVACAYLKMWKMGREKLKSQKRVKKTKYIPKKWYKKKHSSQLNSFWIKIFPPLANREWLFQFDLPGLSTSTCLYHKRLAWGDCMSNPVLFCTWLRQSLPITEVPYQKIRHKTLFSTHTKFHPLCWIARFVPWQKTRPSEIGHNSHQNMLPFQGT